MKRLIWIAVILLSPVFCASAFACSCVEKPNQTPEEVKLERMMAFDRAAAVFTGEVVKIEKGKATFKIDRIWKGGTADEIEITMLIVRDDGYSEVSSCDRHFTLGEKHLIYAAFSESHLKAHYCTPSVQYKKLKDIQPQIEALNEIAEPEVRNKEPKQREQE